MGVTRTEFAVWSRGQQTLKARPSADDCPQHFVDTEDRSLLLACVVKGAGLTSVSSPNVKKA